jgi:hypothetical protein
MPYNPSLYNPYGQQVQVTMQPTGMTPQSPIVHINSIQEGTNYPVAPGNSSPALFLANEDKFLVKIVDANGNVDVRHYKFEDVTPNPMSAFVTKDDFNAAINEIKEAINGKHTTSEATGQSGPASADVTPGNGVSG